MKLDSPKHLARALLAVELPFPDDDPLNPMGPPIELPRRLGEAIFTVIPDVMYRNSETLVESYGPDWMSMVTDYETLCEALKNLTGTGRVDRKVLLRGQSAVERLLERARDDEEVAREMFDPDSPNLRSFNERLGSSTDQIHKGMQESYFSFLCFRCAGDALETLRDGVREIERSLGNDLPGPSRK